MVRFSKKNKSIESEEVINYESQETSIDSEQMGDHQVENNVINSDEVVVNNYSVDNNLLDSSAVIANDKHKNIFTKNIFTKNIFKMISYYSFPLKRNIFFWVLSILLLISQPLTMIILYSLNLDLLDYSFILNISPLIIGLVWLLFLITKLFLENKLNGIDVIMLSKPISKYETFFSRMSVIFIALFSIMIAQFFISSILVFSFNYDIKWITYLLVNNIIITPFISLGISSILILLAIMSKPLWFGLLSFLGFSLLGIAPIATRLINQNNLETNLIFNNDNYHSFSKISIINGEENKTFLVDEINIESQIGVDKDILKTLNNLPFYEYLVPGELILSMSSSLLNDLGFSNNNEIRSNYSLLKNNFVDTSFANLNVENSVLVSIRPEDISPFELTSVEYEDLLLENIKRIVNDNNFINLADEKLVDFLLEKLQNLIDWSTGTLTNSEFQTVRALLGIDLGFTQLFYYFNDKEILEKKTPNLLDKIANEINPALANLLTFLWNDNSSKMNVYDLDSFGDISLIFPSAKIVSQSAPPHSSDVQFIKNDLVRFSGTAVSYLNINKQYTPTTLLDLQKIDPSIVDKTSWDQFIDNSSITLGNLVYLYKFLISNNLNNIYQVNFRPNSDDLFKYSYFIDIQQTTHLDNIYLPILANIFVVIGTNMLAIYMFRNKNYKNTN
ncbi:MAG: hypothetical protein ACRC1F_00790 [Metamycoplasmataceae bacterium]